jgi:eukaryotic-like serine/threonine-protein kinase
MAHRAAEIWGALEGRYRLERELGHGGMATVYLARDLKHDRLVAIKVPRPELATLGPERFLREIRLAAQLQHPHILGLIDSGTFEYQPGLSGLYYVMPYVEGESLRDRLQREGQLPLDDSLRIVREIALALDYAHRHGVIHRDIKPENILLSDTQALIADFGVARALEAAGGERLTETGIALGTPAYLSPEQAAGGRELDGRADIYSLGCVLYEMLAGEPPFTGPTPQAIIAKRFSEPVPHLRTVRDVPEAIEQAVTKALARSPADRFATAAQLASALQTHAGERPTHTQPTAVRVRRRRSRWIGLGVLIALAAVGAILWRSRRPSEPALDANLLAVAPFEVLDPSLALWREGLVDVLSRDLDGAGPLRTVPQTVALRRWQGRADRGSAEAFGRSTGAGIVVFGSLLPRGRDSVTLRATLVDLGSRDREPDLEVSGGGTRLGELADSLGVEILRTLGRTRPIGSVRQVTIGSRTMPALKAFLQGEQFYRKALWDSALVAYDRAIARDSGFTLAHRRVGMVLGWYSPTWHAFEPADSYTHRAARLNHGLPTRDSLLITAAVLDLAAGEATDGDTLLAYRQRAWATLETAAKRYPSDPEVWYTLGESRSHYQSPWIPARALEAFERSIALDPGFAPAYEHTIQLAINVGDPERARRYAAAYVELDPSGASAEEVRLTQRLLDPTLSGSAETLRRIDTASVGALFRSGLEHLGSWTDSAETSIRLLRELAAGGHDSEGEAPWVADSLLWRRYLARALAFRGHLRQAYEVYQSLLSKPVNPSGGFLDPLPDLALFHAVPARVAGRIFSLAFDPGLEWSSNPNFTETRLRGLPWYLARGDTVLLARFARRAEEEGRGRPPPIRQLRARYLGGAAAAYLRLAHGDSASALKAFQRLPEALCLVNDCVYEKLTEARLLHAKGDSRAAMELLDRWIWAGIGSPVYIAGTLERSRIAEALGDRDKAVRGYQFVVDAWRQADPELQPYVTEAREGLARLRGEGEQ